MSRATTRQALAETILTALNEHGASYGLPRDPSDLAHLVADAILATPPAPSRGSGLPGSSGLLTALDDFLAATDDYIWNEHDLKLLGAIRDARAALDRADEGLGGS